MYDVGVIRCRNMMQMRSGTSSTQEKIDFLRDPRNYPDNGTGVEAGVQAIETHFAWVFLTGRHAYKMKKPVQQATMDYRTLASRRRGCNNEVKLNRRLAPLVYIEVVSLVRKRDGALSLDREGDVVEWLVKMHRLPSSRMLDRTIENGSVTNDDLDNVIGMLADFYRSARRAPMSAQAYLERMRVITLQNASDLSAPDLAVKPALFDSVIRGQLSWIADAAPLLGPRGRHLVDGHGDLRLEHVYTGPQPCVIDCLEFDPDLRRLDPAEEIANLALGCLRLERTDLAGRLLHRYRVAMQDPIAESLLQFYMSQRAVIAAKIAAWHMRDPMYTERKPWIERAKSYLGNADRHIRTALDEPGHEQPSSVAGSERPLCQERGEGPAR